METLLVAAHDRYPPVGVPAGAEHDDPVLDGMPRRVHLVLEAEATQHRSALPGHRLADVEPGKALPFDDDRRDATVEQLEGDCRPRGSSADDDDVGRSVSDHGVSPHGAPGVSRRRYPGDACLRPTPWSRGRRSTMGPGTQFSPSDRSRSDPGRHDRLETRAAASSASRRSGHRRQISERPRGRRAASSRWTPRRPTSSSTGEPARGGSANRSGPSTGPPRRTSAPS